MLSLLVAFLLSPETRAFDALAHRLLGRRADSVSYQPQTKAGTDSFTVEATDGHVLIRATSTVAATRGLYDYLKKGRPGHPGSIVNWDGTRLEIGERWWDDKVTATSPAEYRHYFNVCTFGYSTAFWDWKDWEKEIDWMALHGLNFPLAMVGQEAVWQKVWRRHGMSDTEIRSYFTGPAFLPWHRMGNLNSWGGPLPQSWIDNQAALQKKILRRMRELGIKPVEPAFSGFIPPVFAAKHPQLKTRKSSGWAGFEPTILLDPRDPAFNQIGKEFMDEYRKEFGADGYYLADVFNEMPPQVEPATKQEDLKETAKGVYDAIRAGDPSGVWVTQGWLFYNEASFWGEKEIAAYLSGVPKDKILLLDLFAENTEVWRRSAAFREHPYVWCMLHNFGGRTPLAGDLDSLVSKATKALDDPSHGGLVGMGLTMEGINQNPAQYELMCDLMWSRPESADKWFEDFLTARWGSREVAHELAPEMKKVFYSGRGGRLFNYQKRPTIDGPDEPDPILEARPLALKMLDHNELWEQALFRQDTVDVCKQVIEDGFDQVIYNCYQDSVEQKPFDFGQRLVGQSLRLEEALASQPNFRTDRWIDKAVASVAEKDRPLLAQNARLQITRWGGPYLSEYAAKEWSSLVYEYYVARWRIALRAMENGKLEAASLEKSLSEYENGWLDHGIPKDSGMGPWEPSGLNLHEILVREVADAIAVVPHVDNSDKGIAVGKPTTDSGQTEPGGSPANAVDGKVSGGYWAASPAPQWWQVDLGSSTNIDRVQVFTYYDGTRSYQYQVLGSLDGVSWTVLADATTNTTVATRKGVTHPFPATSVRFVRVNVLHNTANIGVHLREVRVFADGVTH